MPASTIVKTEAITLRVAPFSNTSHMVTWLTPEHGKLATAIKGACRPKSPVFGQYDIGYLCELLFYARERNGIHIVKECSTLDARNRCRGDWQRTSAISYLCHLAAIATPDGAHAPELYHVLAACLTHIAAPDTSLPAILLWFELRLLTLLGLSPNLASCTSCAQPLASSRDVVFSATRGGILCRTCDTTSHRSEAFPLSGDALAILRQWQCAPAFDSLQTTPYAKTQREQITPIIASFMIHHLDLAHECYSVAHKMIETSLQR
jgi:DNA repair protein RecO (recombination protein O)